MEQETFQSKANHQFANRCIGYIYGGPGDGSQVNKFDRSMGGGACVICDWPMASTIMGCGYMRPPKQQIHEKVTAVSLVWRLQYCQSCQFSQDDVFCGEDDGFCGKDDGFLAKTKVFYFFFVFAKNLCLRPLFAMCSPHATMFTLHTNEWSNLHWACADILMRESPLLSMCTCCTGHVQT